VPWGICVFLLIALGGLVWTFASKELEAGQYLAAVSGGAGLLAVGHGIRQHGKELSRKNSSATEAPPRSPATTPHGGEAGRDTSRP
jgi:hypothetical protein